MPYPHLCASCHRPFLSRKPHTKYCGNPCRYQGALMPLAVHFWDRVGRCAHGDCPYCCWPWMGSNSSAGYGTMQAERAYY